MTGRCELCGAVYERNGQPRKRFCSRRCQMNAYFRRRLRDDPEFHARALEYQRLWRVRERARARFTAESARSGV